jgi:hypothetical protein
LNFARALTGPLELDQAMPAAVAKQDAIRHPATLALHS